MIGFIIVFECSRGKVVSVTGYVIDFKGTPSNTKSACELRETHIRLLNFVCNPPGMVQTLPVISLKLF